MKDVNRALGNHMVSGTLVDDNVTTGKEDLKFFRVPGSGEFLQNHSKDANRVKPPRKNGRIDTSHTHFKVGNLL